METAAVIKSESEKKWLGYMSSCILAVLIPDPMVNLDNEDRRKFKAMAEYLNDAAVGTSIVGSPEKIKTASAKSIDRSLEIIPYLFLLPTECRPKLNMEAIVVWLLGMASYLETCASREIIPPINQMENEFRNRCITLFSAIRKDALAAIGRF